MSKQKKLDLESETEKVTDENLGEQPALEETAQPAEVESTNTDVVQEVKNEPVENVSEPVSKNPKINTVATTAVKSDKKMGVYKFLSIYPQDIYISTLLKHCYPHSFFTKDEWFQRISELLNTPIYN